MIIHVYVDIWGISRFHNGDNLHGAMGPGYGTSPRPRSHEANDKTAEIQLGKYGKPWEKHIKHGKIWKTMENIWEEYGKIRENCIKIYMNHFCLSAKTTA